MMMSLGMFVFELATVPYQELQQQLAWRHTSASRVGLRPARQFIGPDDEAINFSGVLLPEVTGGELSLAELRQMGDDGIDYVLIDGSGVIYGQYVIESLHMTKSLFFQDGKARRIEFQLALTRVDDDAVERDEQV